MTQVQYQDFTLEDSHKFLHYASLASDPHNCYYTCFWLTAHGPCNMQIPGSDFPEHLRSSHDVPPDNIQLRCLWDGCSAELKRESLVRHIQEKHLGWRYTCQQCGERFTRAYTKENHLRRVHEAN